MNLNVPTSIGELYDKISILEIKSELITDEVKRANVIKELTLLYGIASGFPVDDALYSRLKQVNQKLWRIEDDIRDKERSKDFGQEFIELARSVYVTNDERSIVKKEINVAYNSEIVEEKSYNAY